MRRRKTILAVVLTAAAAVSAAFLVPSGASAATTSGPLPVNYNFIGGATSHTDPSVPPPGSDDWSCKPTAEHPYPVVLVHGTAANQDDNWQAASPYLKNAGYCVFSANFGGPSPTAMTQAVGDITVSAQQLGTFVDKVLAATGAAKVDLVGHSQGGMMPRQYIRFDGGAAKVHALVALAPSNYGVGTGGIGGNPIVSGALQSLIGGFCTACVQQINGSPFLTKLNAGSDTVPGVDYTVIESTRDEIVTPYTNAFLKSTGPNVHNIVLNQDCAQDQAEHLEIAADPRALAMVQNALDPAHPVPVPCIPVRAYVGP